MIFVVMSECACMWCAVGCALLGVGVVCMAWDMYLRVGV